MKIVAMGGEPASGKTVIFKTFKGDRKIKRFKEGLLEGEIDDKRKVIYLGVYKEGLSKDSFCGTDKLSMAVQPVALEFVNKAHKKWKGYTIIFEGDRLFNKKFLKALMLKHDVAIIVLEVEDDILHKRHKKRKGDTQTEKFLKGRKTKVRNIVGGFPVIIREHNDKADTPHVVKLLKKLVGLKTPAAFINYVDDEKASNELCRVFCGESNHTFW